MWAPHLLRANGGFVFRREGKAGFLPIGRALMLCLPSRTRQTMPTGGPAYTEADGNEGYGDRPGRWTGLLGLRTPIRPPMKPCARSLERVCRPKARRRGRRLWAASVLRSRSMPRTLPLPPIVAWFNSRDVQIGKIVQHGGQPVPEFRLGRERQCEAMVPSGRREPQGGESPSSNSRMGSG